MVRRRTNPVNALSSAEVRREEVDVLFMAWLVARSTEDLVGSVLAPTGLTGDDFAIYSVLAAGQVTTPTELARWMAAPATTVSSVVKRLQARGHATRAPNPDDGRSYRITLTTEGRRAHQRAVELFAPLRATIEADLGVDREPIETALLRLRAAVDHRRGLDP